MPIYRRICFFSCLLHILVLLQIHLQIQHTYSALRIVRSNGTMALQAVSHTYQRVNLGATYQKNVKLTIRIANSLLLIFAITWLYTFLLCCGDVHPNPGPNSTTSTDRNLEDAYHFLFVCPLYARQRIILHDSIAQYQFNLTLDLLLFGDLSLSYDANTQIFETVQKYIIDTKRF